MYLRAFFRWQRMGQWIFCLPGKLFCRISVSVWESNIISTCKFKIRKWERRTNPSHILYFQWASDSLQWGNSLAIACQLWKLVVKQVPQTKSVEKHLEMSISMKNTVHVFIALFISVFQWNAPTSAINQLNSHEKKEKKKVGACFTYLSINAWCHLRHPEYLRHSDKSDLIWTHSFPDLWLEAACDSMILRCILNATGYPQQSNCMALSQSRHPATKSVQFSAANVTFKCNPASDKRVNAEKS